MGVTHLHKTVSSTSSPPDTDQLFIIISETSDNFPYFKKIKVFHLLAPIEVHILVVVDNQERSRKFNDPCYVLLQLQNECQILRLADKGEGGM